MTALTGGAAAAERVQFNRDVRPILADKCWSCHGPDGNKRKAGLRLDEPEAARARLKSGAVAIVPGQPAASALWQRIVHSDPDERMPPAEGIKHLSARDKEILQRWIQEGAVWQPHWAYIPPARPPLPAVKQQAWTRNPIDRFVLARLERAGVAPAPVAARHTLLRRLSFDLTGLPPAPAELDAFTRDTRPEAYEAAVDRLLASPHFGERMAVRWLDLVRYADTVGYHSDNEREVSLYRDYVIRAFNDNKPFDQFTIEQLAGDLLPGASFWQRVASGYNRLLQTTEEGGAQPKEYAQKYLADRVRNASTVWLAATFGCAQCHDHKFDPYSLKDFYRFAAFFADVAEDPVGRRAADYLPGAAERAAFAAAERRLRELGRALRDERPALLRAQRRWERAVLAPGTTRWTPLEPVAMRSQAGARLLFMSNEDSVEVSGWAAERDTYTVTVAVPMDGVTGFLLEALPDKSSPWLGPGRTADGGFTITALSARDARTGAALALGRPVASRGRARAAGPPSVSWSVPTGLRAPERLMLRPDRPRDFGADGRVTFVIAQDAGAGRTLARFRISATRDREPLQVDPGALAGEVLAAVVTPADRRTREEENMVAGAFRKLTPALAPARARLVAAERAFARLTTATPRTLLATAVAPQPVRVLPRGDWLDESGEEVTPGVPAVLSPIRGDAGRATRLDLARWLMSPANPLTARVLANRLWAQFFGAGLSRNQEDFGRQGDWPTHPELLDWLAVELRERGWDVKHLVRLMVTSAAYRQSSVPARALLERDPDNQLLARQARFRLDAELVRDNALAVSGLLSRQIGGPSVKPYQPDGYWANLNFPPREWIADAGASQYRRGLYTFWQRTFLHPALLAFDAPTREECTGERTRANIPQQALVLLNDPSFVEAARVLAAEVLRRGGASTAERLRWSYGRVLQRPPSDAEARALGALHDRHLAQYRADPQAARDLLAVGLSPRPPGLDAAELAAWTSVTRALLAAPETITRP